jgi:hypothetical protein
MSTLRIPFLLCLSFTCTRACAEDITPVDFNRDIRPIFAQHCISCHGGVKQAGNLSFVYRDQVFNGGDSGTPAVVPEKPDESYLMERVTDADPDMRMPPADHGPALSTTEIETLRRWIAEGANWELPWAFVVPKQTPLPQVQQADWCLQPLDRFVLAKLEENHLQPSPTASRTEWLRRVSFDLIGLPPSEQEADEFLNDTSGNAYEKVVDRLLVSPHFGERWASLWLDLARYADTTGYEKDPHRNIWPYRDWVIRAFNSDMPFDEFTIKQLAGDLLENASYDDVLATAFHRNTQTNTEGGTDDEEFRIASVIDRVNTTWQVWQATTFGCTQCHSHPYEPFEHDEYYKFLAVFDNTKDADVDEDFPLLPFAVDSKDEQLVIDNWKTRNELQRAQHRQLSNLANQDRWKPLTIETAESTKAGQLAIKEESGRTEVLITKTPANQATFTLESPIPDLVKQITALRIDAFPQDPEAAKKIPEIGFILSQLKASIIPPNGKEAIELKFSLVFSDDPHPLVNPNDSLNDNIYGWGSYSRQWKSHHAVFLLKTAATIKPGSRIRLELIQNAVNVGDVALVLNRSSYSCSSNDAWIDLQTDAEFVAANEKLAALSKQLKAVKKISVPVLAELSPENRRITHVFTRGLWLDKAELVNPGTPQVFPELHAEHADRLAVAKWLVSDENPLTPRVMVNRLWAQLFGTGIVETAEDFGTSGTLPTHPELLDHLALTFRDKHSWSIKNILRDIVLSATYRQQSKASPELLEADPGNRLFTRGPRQRLTAEMVRDQAITLSGRFSDKMFGPPVMPPQPEGIWRSVYNNAKWVTATGENRYRRAVYTYWKRTSGYPSMLTFDAPSRDVCTARRITTNTPLQALVTLNDEAFIECAQGLAEQMIAQDSSSLDERIAWAFERATSQEPSAGNLKRLQNLFENAHQYYETHSDESDKLGKSAEQAAYVIVASTILNLDEALTK